MSRIRAAPVRRSRARSLPGNDQSDDGHGEGSEQCDQGTGEVVGDGAGPGGGAKCRCMTPLATPASLLWA